MTKTNTLGFIIFSINVHLLLSMKHLRKSQLIIIIQLKPEGVKMVRFHNPVENADKEFRFEGPQQSLTKKTIL